MLWVKYANLLMVLLCVSVKLIYILDVRINRIAIVKDHFTSNYWLDDISWTSKSEASWYDHIKSWDFDIIIKNSIDGLYIICAKPLKW